MRPSIPILLDSMQFILVKTENLGKCNSISLKVRKFIYECKCQHLMYHVI